MREDFFIEDDEKARGNMSHRMSLRLLSFSTCLSAFSIRLMVLFL